MTTDVAQAEKKKRKKKHVVWRHMRLPRVPHVYMCVRVKVLVCARVQVLVCARVHLCV